jgi:tRNA (pseudouridine54-N1)-methyltransferase
MRNFIYYSKSAPTSGNQISDDLQKSGRLDIAIHTVIASFFLSHSIREDVQLHLAFDGPSDPPKHLLLAPVLEGKTDIDKIYLNKKDISKIIKKMLYKYKPNENNEVFPGYFIEKKPLINILKELSKQNKEIYILDPKGEDIRSIEISKDPVFLIGDHEGLPALKKEIKRIPHRKVSVGNKTYFASQTVTIINNELDRQKP